MNEVINKPLIRLLLVEDDQVRLICKRALEAYADCNFEVFEAETGAEGLRLAHTEAFDCILLDHDLPDFNGVEFLTELTKEINSPSIPVIMLTGSDNAMLAVEALKLGAYDFLVKGSERQPLQWLPPIILRTLREHQSNQAKAAADEQLREAEAQHLYHLESLVRERTEQLERQNTVLNDTNTHLSQTLHELKQAEAELRIAAVAFESQAGIAVTDANQAILQVNKAFTRITGYRAEEATLLSFLHIQQPQPQFFQAIWASVEREGYWQGEVWEIGKEGEDLALWLTLTKITDPQGVVSHYAATFTDITAQKQAEKVLLEARERLENQVANTQEELEKIKVDTADVNMALNVLLRHRQKDKSEAQLSLSLQVEETLMPLLKKLKVQSAGRLQSTRIIGIIESNLQQLMGSYGSAANLDAAYRRLSPQEVQVAAMVRQGLATKAIATTLSISSGTVEIHRKHIRKKLEVDTKTNLRSHLLSLTD